MKRLIALLFAFVLVVAAHADEGYQTPPKELAALVDAPPTPSMNVGPGDWAVLTEAPLFLTIADLAQPELKLAGLRFNPRNHEQTRFGYNRDLRILRVSSGEQRAIAGLPQPLRARLVTWSADGARIAFTQASEDGVELWVVDAAGAKASRVGSFLLNASDPSRAFHWLGN